MLAFAGGQAAGVVGGVMESVAGFFGKDSPLEQVAKLSKDKDINVPRLQAIGKGIHDLGLGFQALGAADSSMVAANLSSLNNTGGAAFNKSLAMANTSQENKLAGVGGTPPIVINNNNVDNSMQNTQTTAVNVPESTRQKESTLGGVLSALNPFD